MENDIKFFETFVIDVYFSWVILLGCQFSVRLRKNKKYLATEFYILVARWKINKTRIVSNILNIKCVICYLIATLAVVLLE